MIKKFAMKQYFMLIILILMIGSASKMQKILDYKPIITIKDTLFNPVTKKWLSTCLSYSTNEVNLNIKSRPAAKA